MATFQEVITPVTIANYGLGAWNGIAKHNPMIKALRDLATWEYDYGGDHFEGVVEAGRDKVIISVPGMDLSQYLVPSLRYQRWVCPAFGEALTAKSIDLGVLRRNRGMQALVKLRDKEIPAQCRDLIEGVDGILHQFLNQNINSPTGTNAAGGLPFSGLPSFLFAPGSSGLNGFDGEGNLTGVAVATTDREATPTSQVYNGLSLAYNGLSGLTVPTPDAWTPTLVNLNSSVFGAGGVSGNILPGLQWMANRARRFSAKNPEFNPDKLWGGWLDFNYFQFLGAAIAAKQTIYIDKGDGSAAPNAPLGTDSEALPHAGLLWHWDERMPANSSYIINWKQTFVGWQELYMGIDGNGNPLGKDGEDAGIMEVATTYDPVRRQWLATATAPGQFAFNPRYFARGGLYA